MPGNRPQQRKGVNRAMISRDNVQVFGNVPKAIKRRIKRVTAHSEFWSESKIIREGLLRILPELEEQLEEQQYVGPPQRMGQKIPTA